MVQIKFQECVRIIFFKFGTTKPMEKDGSSYLAKVIRKDLKGFSKQNILFLEMKSTVLNRNEITYMKFAGKLQCMCL